MAKKNYISRMTFEIEYTNGVVESTRCDASEAKHRFYVFVRAAVDKYLDGFFEARLLDSAGRVFRSYCQHF